MPTEPVELETDERFFYLLDASERLAAAGSVDEVVAVLHRTARAAVGAEAIAVVIDGRCFFVAEDAVSPLWQGQNFAAADCVSGWVMRDSQTLIIPDVKLDPRIPQDAYSTTFRSLIMVPIGRPVPVAALGAYWSKVRDHTCDTVKRLESLASLATIAINNVRLIEARNHEAALRDAQNRILKLSVEDTPVDDVLDAIIREAEASPTSRFLGCIVLVNKDLNLLRCSGPSLPRAFNDDVMSIMSGLCGAAPLTSNASNASSEYGVFSDQLQAGLRELASRYGLYACSSFPIRSTQNVVLGIFVMYHHAPREPLTTNVQIVDFIVQTVGLVLQRDQTKAKMRVSEARYRQIVDGAEDFAIITFDAQGTVTTWSTGAQCIVGYGSSDVVGRKGDFFYTDIDQAHGVFYQELRIAQEQGRAVNERWQARKDGTRFWGSGLLMPLALDQGGFVKIFRDRTAEHQAQAALAESTSRLRFFDKLDGQLFHIRHAEDAMNTATEMLGLELDVSRCAYADVDDDNDRFWIRSDYNAPGMDSSVGTYSLDVFGPRAADKMRAGRTLVICDVTAELAQGEGLETFRAIGIDAIICCPLVKDGRLTAMMAVHQNSSRDWAHSEISLVKEVAERCWAHVERVGAEMRLYESEERLRLAVENADIGFWDVDIVRNTLIWPAQTKAMFGISADVPVTLQDFYDGLHPADRDSTIEAFTAAIDSQRRALYEVDYRTIGREDGIVRWVAAKGRAVFDASGRCLRFTGTAVDVTPRKIAEEELRELNGTLELRVAYAIAEREEAQQALRQSQKMEAMGQLTGGVAHDFNNLLTPILGALDMLQRRGVGSDREQRLISGALQSADRAKTLVQRLLAFARRQPLQAVPVDVVKLISDMGELVASTTGPQIKVVIDAPLDLPAAMADPNQLEMAILNLSVNARDAMLEGGTLRISASTELVENGHRSHLPTGTYVCLSVADTGGGMDANTLDRAVEPFFSTKGVGKGTGLGLSMVHGLASQLNGALTIQSAPGLGTNVELWLPRSMTMPAAASPVTEAPKRQPVRGTALLVDDEELVRATTSYMLADLGYLVIEATSGEEALQMLEAGHRVDLVVTDHLMPGISGTELARAVHALAPGVPVLLVSGYAERKGLDPNIPRLHKPFRKDELAASLSQLVGL